MIRFTHIPDTKIPGLFDDVVGGELGCEGEEYQAVFNKVCNWCKNWPNQFIVVAEGIMKDLKAKYGWAKISRDQLKALYRSKCGYEHLYQHPRGFGGSTVDLCRTISPFTVVYVFVCDIRRTSAGASIASRYLHVNSEAPLDLSRQQCLNRITVMGFASAFASRVIRTCRRGHKTLSKG